MAGRGRSAANADAAAVISRNVRRSIFVMQPSLAPADYSDAAPDSRPGLPAEAGTVDLAKAGV
jgi:hypothetical protein